MAVLLAVNGLRKEFGTLTAVNDLSFTVNEGDIYGFLGQNGAGKSTTIRMLLTLIAPTAGSINIFGKSLHQHREEILSQIGAIIERPDLYKFMTAYDNLDLFARLSGLKPSRAQLMEQLDKVGLADRANSKAKTFSQGMKQRLGIAIALVHNPRLVVLDEPTNGLDPQGIAEMRAIIKDLSAVHGKTVMVSSHLLYEIEQMATRMIIIDKGKKVVEGTTAELFDPADTLVELETNDPEALQKIKGSPWNSHLQPGETLVFKIHAHQVPELAAALVAMDVPISNLYKKHSLETLFLSLTGAVRTSTNASQMVTAN
ncbi:MAG: ABC transporter ATP-binding protein [Bacteroidetes bacterium]|nr:MAG: ABC transporter ATP-binding protein [Bacteroidota bacterium]